MNKFLLILALFLLTVFAEYEQEIIAAHYFDMPDPLKSSKSLEYFKKYLTDDCHAELEKLDEKTAVGPQAIMEMVSKIHAAAPDGEVHIEDAFSDGNVVIVEADFHYTDENGKKRDFEFVAVCTMRLDKISSYKVYGDFGGFHDSLDGQIKKICSSIKDGKIFIKIYNLDIF